MEQDRVEHGPAQARARELEDDAENVGIEAVGRAALEPALPFERDAGALDRVDRGRRQVTGLGHDERPRAGLLEDGADELLRPAVGVVRRGVDEVAAACERHLERGAMLRIPNVDPIAAEPDPGQLVELDRSAVAHARGAAAGAGFRAR